MFTRLAVGGADRLLMGPAEAVSRSTLIAFGDPLPYALDDAIDPVRVPPPFAVTFPFEAPSFMRK